MNIPTTASSRFKNGQPISWWECYDLVEDEETHSARQSDGTLFKSFLKAVGVLCGAVFIGAVALLFFSSYKYLANGMGFTFSDYYTVILAPLIGLPICLFVVLWAESRTRM